MSVLESKFTRSLLAPSSSNTLSCSWLLIVISSSLSDCSSSFEVSSSSLVDWSSSFIDMTSSLAAFSSSFEVSSSSIVVCKSSRVAANSCSSWRSTDSSLGISTLCASIMGCSGCPAKCTISRSSAPSNVNGSAVIATSSIACWRLSVVVIVTGWPSRNARNTAVRTGERSSSRSISNKLCDGSPDGTCRYGCSLRRGL